MLECPTEIRNAWKKRKANISNAVRNLARRQTGTPPCTQGRKKETLSAMLYFDSWITLQIHLLHAAINKSICILKEAQISSKCTQLTRTWKRESSSGFSHSEDSLPKGLLWTTLLDTHRGQLSVKSSIQLTCNSLQWLIFFILLSK